MNGSIDKALQLVISNALRVADEHATMKLKELEVGRCTQQECEMCIIILFSAFHCLLYRHAALLGQDIVEKYDYQYQELSLKSYNICRGYIVKTDA